jgi:hypothetical protein
MQRLPGLKLTSALPQQGASLSAVQQRVLKGERLSPNPGELKRAKEAAEKASRGARGGRVDTPSLESALSSARSASAAEAPRPAPQAPEGALTTPARGDQGDVGIAGVPTTIISSLGQSDSRTAPADAVVAAGPDRYIQLVNSRFGIYSYTSGTPIAQGTLNEFTNVGIIGAAFSPQIMWDPDTNRFYYATALTLGPIFNAVTFGFSKTATPASAADFCNYFTPTNFANVTSLGDTQNWTVIGSEFYDATTGAFLQTDLALIRKPSAGSTCPDGGSLVVGAFPNVTNTVGEQVVSPAAANQIDASTTGHLVAASNVQIAGQRTALAVFQLVETEAGMNMFKADMSVPAYAIPADAEQPGTTNRLNTGLAGPTQAVSAIDPTREDAVGLWTQHTVFGGAGASVRWYEINPADPPSIIQSGEVVAPGVYFFNAAISPDRNVVGATKRFGGSMGLGMNASSTNLRASVITASKVGDGAIGYKFVALSPAVLNDFTCASGVCNWGNYAGASPAPINAPSLTQGLIVHSTSFVQSAGSPTASGWGSLNMYIVPQ